MTGTIFSPLSGHTQHLIFKYIILFPQWVYLIPIGFGNLCSIWLLRAGMVRITSYSPASCTPTLYISYVSVTWKLNANKRLPLVYTMTCHAIVTHYVHIIWKSKVWSFEPCISLYSLYKYSIYVCTNTCICTVFTYISLYNLLYKYSICVCTYTHKYKFELISSQPSLPVEKKAPLTDIKKHGKTIVPL